MKAKKPNNKIAKQRPAASGSPMDVDLLQQIVKLMASNDLNTVDVREGEKRIILKRGAVYAAAPVMVAAPTSTSTAAAPAAAGPAAAVDENAGLIAIESPMVGTFYSSPNPDSKPFVQVGSVVNEETEVCVIEAMKVFNTIKAECRGTIAKIVVQNGEPVDVKKVLFLVKPS